MIYELLTTCFHKMFSRNVKHESVSIFHVENGFFGQEAYNIIFFLFLMENSIVKIFGSVDVKITPNFCS